MENRRAADPADARYVSEQYESAHRLDARRRLYSDFRQPGSPSLMSWTFGNLGLRPGMRVLEVGCGTGSLWQENLELLPDDLDLTLSDNAHAMLRAAKERLGEGRFRYVQCDVASLPASDGSFDLVIANHMLYHIVERKAVLREIARVLRPGGRLCATTNGWTHIIELRALIERFHPEAHALPPRPLPDAFDVENGAEELARVFPRLFVKNYRSALHVTDAAVVAEYVRSILPRGQDSMCQALREAVERTIELQGEFYVSTWVGLFVATKDAP